MMRGPVPAVGANGIRVDGPARCRPDVPAKCSGAAAHSVSPFAARGREDFAVIFGVTELLPDRA